MKHSCHMAGLIKLQNGQKNGLTNSNLHNTSTVSNSSMRCMKTWDLRAAAKGRFLVNNKQLTQSIIWLGKYWKIGLLMPFFPASLDFDSRWNCMLQEKAFKTKSNHWSYCLSNLWSKKGLVSFWVIITSHFLDSKSFSRTFTSVWFSLVK